MQHYSINPQHKTNNPCNSMNTNVVFAKAQHSFSTEVVLSLSALWI